MRKGMWQFLCSVTVAAMLVVTSFSCVAHAASIDDVYTRLGYMYTYLREIYDALSISSVKNIDDLVLDISVDTEEINTWLVQFETDLTTIAANTQQYIDGDPLDSSTLLLASDYWEQIVQLQAETYNKFNQLLVDTQYIDDISSNMYSVKQNMDNINSKIGTINTQINSIIDELANIKYINQVSFQMGYLTEEPFHSNESLHTTRGYVNYYSHENTIYVKIPKEAFSTNYVFGNYYNFTVINIPYRRNYLNHGDPGDVLLTYDNIDYPEFVGAYYIAKNDQYNSFYMPSSAIHYDIFGTNVGMTYLYLYEGELFSGLGPSFQYDIYLEFKGDEFLYYSGSNAVVRQLSENAQDRYTELYYFYLRRISSQIDQIPASQQEVSSQIDSMNQKVDQIRQSLDNYSEQLSDNLDQVSPSGMLQNIQQQGEKINFLSGVIQQVYLCFGVYAWILLLPLLFGLILLFMG